MPCQVAYVRDTHGTMYSMPHESELKGEVPQFDGFHNLHQFTRASTPYFSSSQSLAFLKWSLPKNPFALNGDGCYRLKSSEK